MSGWLLHCDGVPEPVLWPQSVLQCGSGYGSELLGNGRSWQNAHCTTTWPFAGQSPTAWLLVSAWQGICLSGAMTLDCGRTSPGSSLFSMTFFFLRYYVDLKGKVTESEREKVIFGLLVHSSNALKCEVWAGPKLGARSFL